MIEKREKLCYGVGRSREVKAEAGHRSRSYILGPGNAAIPLADSAADSTPVMGRPHVCDVGGSEMITVIRK